MIFEWDDGKDTANLAKHDISFGQAIGIFQGRYVSREDDRQSYGETRILSLGELSGQIIIVVVHTARNGNMRIISARRANKKERQVYHDYCNQTSA